MSMYFDKLAQKQTIKIADHRSPTSSLDSGNVRPYGRAERQSNPLRTLKDLSRTEQGRVVRLLSHGMTLQLSFVGSFLHCPLTFFCHTLTFLLRSHLSVILLQKVVHGNIRSFKKDQTSPRRKEKNLFDPVSEKYFNLRINQQ